MRKIIILVALLGLSACASGRTVQLSRGSDIVQCGPYSSPSIGVSSNLDEFAERKLQACIEKLQDQGYQIVYPANGTAASPPEKQ